MKTVYDIKSSLHKYSIEMGKSTRVHDVIKDFYIGNIHYLVKPLRIKEGDIPTLASAINSYKHPSTQVLVVKSKPELMTIFGDEADRYIDFELECTEVYKGTLGIVFGARIISLQYRIPDVMQPQQFHKFTGDVNAYIITQTNIDEIGDIR